jgi:hypothetical protein
MPLALAGAQYRVDEEALTRFSLLFSPSLCPLQDLAVFFFITDDVASLDGRFLSPFILLFNQDQDEGDDSDGGILGKDGRGQGHSARTRKKSKRKAGCNES